ncbi:MAG: ABC transporter permease [Filifactoraceae bacterium]
MNRIWMLTFARIKKNIYASLVFVLMISISSFLITTSFSVEDSFGILFDNLYKSTNSADYTVIFPKSYVDSNDELYEFLRKDIQASGYETEDALIFLKTPIFTEKSGKLQGSWIIRNMDIPRNISKIKIIERARDIYDNSIYVPYICKSLFGFELGSELNFEYGGEVKTFIISGFTEDILYGNKASIAFTVTEGMFREMSGYMSEEEQSKIVLIKSESSSLKQKFIQYIKEAPYATGVSREEAMFSMYSTLNVYKKVLLFFSMINLVIVCLVMHFRIRDSFYKDYKDIGVLRALGFSNNDIRNLFIFQYALLSAIGTALGMLFFILFSSKIMPSITAETGIQWQNFFHVVRMGEIIFLNWFIVILLATCFTMIIKKINPVVALRGYNSNFLRKTSHSFFSRIHLPLNLVSAIYLFFSRRKQNLIIILIISIAMMSSSFFLTLFTNIVRNENGLSQISGMEKFDIVLKFKEESNYDKYYDIIDNIDGVKDVIKSIGPGAGELLCDDLTVGRVTVYSDYDKIEKIGLYEGRYPKHDNEIAISANLSKELGKSIGDVVFIRNEYTDKERAEQFIVTGLTQGSYTGGMDIYFKLEGLKKIDPSALWEVLYLYLPENADVENVISEIKLKMGSDLLYIENFKELFDSQFYSVKMNIASVVYFALGMSLLITLVIVILLTKTVMLNNEHDFGVMRAMGYTTYQISTQVSISIVPILLAAAVVSYLLSILFTNKILVLVLQGMGVYNLKFELPNGFIAFYIVVTIFSSYIISMLYLYRMRRYSPNYFIKEGE